MANKSNKTAAPREIGISFRMVLTCFVLFLFYVFKSMKRSDVEVDAEGVSMKTGMAVFAILGGLAALILGGRWVVNSAVDLARMFHVSEKVIGLTIVAMGTSLPELVTSLVAIRKKSADMAIGNVIGSNIFNIFLILGTSAMIRPMVYSTAFNHDLLLLLAGTVLLLVAMFTGGKRRLDRWEAFILLAVYVAYLVYVALRN